jgi:hypothetical protein
LPRIGVPEPDSQKLVRSEVFDGLLMLSSGASLLISDCVSTPLLAPLGASV